MTTACKHSLTVLLCLLLGACLCGEGSGAQRSSLGDASEWRWGNVAAFQDPVMYPETDRRISLIFDALNGEGIRWIASSLSGSMSLSVDSRDFPRGREIVQQIAQEYDLSVFMSKL